VGGWRTLWREVGQADVVVANGARNLLPAVATFFARIRRRRVLFVLHGSGAGFSTSSFVYHRLLGSIFERLVTRPALRRSVPISLSRAGVTGARRRYGVAAAYVPYPLRILAAVAPDRPLRDDEPLRIVWVGRLYPEKDPLRAVAVVEEVRLTREATLDFYGEGILAQELEVLARDRPWVRVRGGRPWERIQHLQAEAHVCLSTSLRDATQIAILEPLSRGLPVVSTSVGDAPRHYIAPAVRRYCVEPANVDASAAALLEIAGAYERHRHEFAENARLLRDRHRMGQAKLVSLVHATASSRSEQVAHVRTAFATELSESTQ